MSKFESNHQCDYSVLQTCSQPFDPRGKLCIAFACLSPRWPDLLGNRTPVTKLCPFQRKMQLQSGSFAGVWDKRWRHITEHG